MTTFAFTPTASANFQFVPTLDGNQYTAIVTWNLFGQRYYISIYALDGTRVLTTPLIGSPTDFDIDLVGGYFASTMVYQIENGQIVVTP